MRITNLIYWPVFLLCVVGSHTCAANRASDSLRLELQKIYTSQIGVKEATGKNDGPQIKAYLIVSGLPEGHPWCAAFVAWCFKTAGIKATRSAYSPNWFPRARIVKNGKVGDVIGIYFPKMGRIAHVGFWDSINGAFTICVEGNTNDEGSREGNRVVRKRRLTKQIRVISNWIE
jgi:hypothetical protein